MKRIILTGGGTAGHITPNIALVPLLRQAGFDIHYVGLSGGMEEKLIAPLGVPFHGIRGGKLRRYADFRNVTDLFRISAGFFESVGLMRELKPDLVFSKGGFVSTPVVWAASSCGVPVVSHESDMTVGLANRLAAPFVKKICCTFPQTVRAVGESKGVLTGLPIRRELLEGSRAKGLAFCGFSADQPVLLIIGGSQGSRFINETVRGSLGELSKIFRICHICGKGNIDPSLADTPGYRQFEYLTQELPDIFAMADVVVTRGGATSLFELLALRKPGLIIPYSLKASRGDQIVNAEFFRKQGFSEVLAEVSPDGQPLSPVQFREKLIGLYNNRAVYVAKMEKCPLRDGLSNVFAVIKETAGI